MPHNNIYPSLLEVTVVASYNVIGLRVQRSQFANSHCGCYIACNWVTCAKVVAAGDRVEGINSLA